MPKFIYRAKESPEKVIKGTIEAGDIDQAVDRITKLGYVPIDVFADTDKHEERRKHGERRHQSEKSLSGLFHYVSSADVTLFTRQMYDLIDAGIPLLRALQLILNQTRNLKLHDIVSDMYTFVEDGGTFSEALARNKGIFSPLYINMVRAGEISGQLGNVLSRLAEYTEKDQQVRSKIKWSLVYPALILIVGGITFVILMAFVIPRITIMFEDMEGALPLITRILIGVSNFFARFWWLIIGLGSLMIFYLMKLRSFSRGKLWVDSLMLKVPVLGGIIKDMEIGRFARTLATLLENGVVIVPALQSVCEVLSNSVIKKQISKLSEEVDKGTSLTKAVEKCGFIPEAAINIIAVGEETGNLEGGLYKLAGSYERRNENATNAMMSLLGPVLILCVGVVVGFTVIAMLLPLFRMNLIIQ